MKFYISRCDGEVTLRHFRFVSHEHEHRRNRSRKWGTRGNPIQWGFGVAPQRGPGAEPMVRGSATQTESIYISKVQMRRKFSVFWLFRYSRKLLTYVLGSHTKC